MDEAGLKLSSGSNEQATLIPMIHPVLSTNCGSEASPRHVPIHGSKPSTTHSSGYRSKRSLIGRALPHKEISVLYRRPPRTDEGGLKLSSGSNEQATLVLMIHPVLSTSCGSEASPPHVPIHGSKPSTTHSSGYRSKGSRTISDAKQGTLFDIGIRLVPHSLKPNFERASSMGTAFSSEISLPISSLPRMDQAVFKAFLPRQTVKANV
ncbi:hypothetical protein FCV25MIE_19453 [Fagus crenata]